MSALPVRNRQNEYSFKIDFVEALFGGSFHTLTGNGWSFYIPSLIIGLINEESNKIRKVGGGLSSKIRPPPLAHCRLSLRQADENTLLQRGGVALVTALLVGDRGPECATGAAWTEALGPRLGLISAGVRCSSTLKNLDRLAGRAILRIGLNGTLRGCPDVLLDSPLRPLPYWFIAIRSLGSAHIRRHL